MPNLSVKETFEKPKTYKFWGQEVEETNSGKTWKVFIRHAFWNKTVGINARIVNKACELFERRLQISCLDPDVDFTIPAWKVKLTGTPYYRKSKFVGSPDMKFYMIPISEGEIGGS